MRVSLAVNGKPASADVEPRKLLVDFLRDELGLTGTKNGCETGQCGACTVLLNGASVKSCMVLAVQAEGQRSGHHRGPGRKWEIESNPGGLLGAARRSNGVPHPRPDPLPERPLVAVIPAPRRLRSGLGWRVIWSGIRDITTLSARPSLPRQSSVGKGRPLPLATARRPSSVHP